MAGEAIAAAARKLGSDAPLLVDAVLARIGGELGSRARAANAAIKHFPPAAQKLQRAQWMAVARIPVPEGFRAIHPTWIEAELAELPPRARTAVANAGADLAPVDVWLARCALASFVGMPNELVDRVTAPADLAALPHDTLRAWLEAAGADQLARAAQIAGAEMEALAARDPELAVALERIARAPRRGQLGADRTVVRRCGGVQGDETRLARLGARALASYVSPRLRRQLAQRLPRALGLVVYAELCAHSAAVDAPTWLALTR